MATHHNTSTTRILNSILDPKNVPEVEDPFLSEVPCSAKPPNPRIGYLYIRSELAAYPFDAAPADDLPLDKTRPPAFSPQVIVDFLNRSGISADDYYQAKPVVDPAQRAPLPLNQALDKVTYGKFFPQGFPVDYNTQTIRFDCIRRELSDLLNAKPEGNNTKLFFQKQTRTEFYKEVEQLQRYAKEIELALRDGRPIPMYINDPTDLIPKGRYRDFRFPVAAQPQPHVVTSTEAEDSDDGWYTASEDGEDAEDEEPKMTFHKVPIKQVDHFSTLTEAVKTFAGGESDSSVIIHSLAMDHVTGNVNVEVEAEDVNNEQNSRRLSNDNEQPMSEGEHNVPEGPSADSPRVASNISEYSQAREGVTSAWDDGRFNKATVVAKLTGKLQQLWQKFGFGRQ